MDTKQLVFFNSEFATNENTVSGVALRYGSLSHDRGGYRAMFRPGSFTDLKQFNEAMDIKAFVGHDYEGPSLGRTKNNTLRILDTGETLDFQLDLPDTTLGRDTLAELKRGDIWGVSVSVVPVSFDWVETEDNLIFAYNSAQLFEISLVYDPAFSDTSVRLVAHSAVDDAAAKYFAEKTAIQKRKIQNRMRMAGV